MKTQKESVTVLSFLNQKIPGVALELVGPWDGYLGRFEMSQAPLTEFIQALEEAQEAAFPTQSVSIAEKLISH